MLDISYIRNNVDEVKKNCEQRNMTCDVDGLLVADTRRRALQQDLDDLRAEQKKQPKGKPTEGELVARKELSQKISDTEESLRTILVTYKELLSSVPNRMHPESPVGGEEDYVVVSTKGSMPEFGFTPKDHEELLTDADLLDFERGAKVAGSKFYFAKGDLVRLNMGLLQYGLSIAEKHGFMPIETPDMARLEILEGAGFNPRGEEDQIYTVENTDLALIGTAEITTLGLHANEIMDLSNGPVKYAAMSHCYRKESGAYGRTSKGLYRVHQFTKLELFVFCKKEESDTMHQELLALEKEICDGLEFPYRVIDIPSADLGAPAYKKYDIEALMVMNGNEKDIAGYGEITSTSNCTDYQSRRLQIRYKNEKGQNEFVHTLNGTAIVLSRFPIAIAENFQQEDGRIKLPAALVPFVGKEYLGK